MEVNFRTHMTSHTKEGRQVSEAALALGYTDFNLS